MDKDIEMVFGWFYFEIFSIVAQKIIKLVNLSQYEGIKWTN